MPHRSRSSLTSRNVTVKLLACVSLLATTPHCQSTEDSGSTPFVMGGTQVSSGDPIARATAALVAKDVKNPHLWSIICSGTLVETQFVVTAAHCIDQDRVFVQFPAVEGQKDKVYGGRAIKHESFDHPYNEPWTFDLALIRLDGAVPPPMKPISIAPTGAYKVGDEVFLAGFGVTSRSENAASNNDAGKLYLARTRIADIFQPGDEETREDTDNWGLITYTSADGRTGACTGDSGGPMFIGQSGSLQVIGATVGGYDRCNTTGKYTHLAFYRSWLAKHGMTTP